MAFRKHDAGKPRTDLLPPSALVEIARVLGSGAARYGDRNWKKGRPARYYAALLRHLLAYWSGETHDPDSGERHLAHAASNVLFLMELTREGKREDLQAQAARKKPRPNPGGHALPRAKPGRSRADVRGR